VIKEEVLSKLEINGILVAKRCTESYLIKHGLFDFVNKNTPDIFVTVSEKIRHLKYGGGLCLTCGCVTKVCANGGPFEEYCSQHKTWNKGNRTAHNKKELDMDLIKHLYYEDKLSFLDIAKKLGDVSNVTIMKSFTKHNLPRRTHSETQKLKARPGIPTGDVIKIDKDELIHQYQVLKIPVKTLARRYSCDGETIRKRLLSYGIKLTHRRTDIEQIIAELLDKHNIKFKPNDRKTLKGKYEIDFLLLDYNIGIEVHGVYHHSIIKTNNDKLYHYRKYELSKEAGIKLFQFWGCEINDSIDIIESIILNACGLSLYSIGARKCKVKPISYSVLADFCLDNHMLGAPGKNTKGTGLYYNEQLVSIIGYIKTESKTTITRFCSLLNYNIVGGFSKLLKQVPGNMIITYSANDISDGNLYSRHNFKNIRSCKSDMWYIDQKYNQLLNRQKFMKHKLKHLPAYSDDKTEQTIMLESGYGIAYRSGTKTWVLER
jgi:very-short-patch-repair endonuclease